MSRRHLLVIGIAAAVILGAGIFWYIRQQGYRFGQTLEPSFSPGPQITEDKDEHPEAAYEAIGYTTSSAGTEIFTVNPDDSKRRIVFVDKDESLKIKTVRFAYDEGRKVLAHLAKRNDQSASILGSITIGGTVAIRTLLENFGATEAPISSPDGKRIAYIVFSNADPDVGYSVMIMNNDGSNKRRLTHSDRLVTNLAFKPDGTAIAYISDQGGSMAIQTIRTDGSGTPHIITEYTNETLYDLSWGNKLYFGKRPSGEADANKGEVYSISEQGSNLHRLTTNDFFDGNPVVSPDGAMLALTRASFSAGKYSTAGELTLIIILLEDKREIEISSTDGILGWQIIQGSLPR